VPLIYTVIESLSSKKSLWEKFRGIGLIENIFGLPKYKTRWEVIDFYSKDDASICVQKEVKEAELMSNSTEYTKTHINNILKKYEPSNISKIVEEEIQKERIWAEKEMIAEYNKNKAFFLNPRNQSQL
jgi:hypothetical protein